MIVRRVVVVAILLSFTTALVAPQVVRAQQGARVYRVGVLRPSTAAAAERNDEAFQQALRERGYVEGQNIFVERRHGAGELERLAELAGELVRMKLDMIVASTDSAIAAVKRHTRSIPIVMVGASDPVGTGFVASLARPGGNITGLSRMSPELSAKRLALLKEVLPKLSRMAVIWDPNVRGAVLDFKELEAPARSLRVRLQSGEVSDRDDLVRAFGALTQARAEAAIVITPNAVAFANQSQLVTFAQKQRVVFMYGTPEYADAGGLIAYGASQAESWRQSVTYVDKILKGANPADLPVEQPTKFELVVNLKTAKALGLTIPPSLLRRADRIVQ